MTDLANVLGVKNGQEFTVKCRVVNNTLEYYNDIVGEWRTVKIDTLSLQVGDIYYVPDIACQYDKIITYTYQNDEVDNYNIDSGLACKTEEEAEKLAEYLLKKVKEYKENE